MFYLIFLSLVERGQDGSPLSTFQCLSCSPGTRPSPDRSACLPCRHPPVLEDTPLTDCNCSLSGGVCLPVNLGILDKYSPSSKDEIFKFRGKEMQSAFLKEHVKVAAYMCSVSLEQVHEA